MNVEMFFIKTNSRDSLITILRERLNTPPDPAGKQPDWGLPASYDSVLLNEQKRKIAVSPNIGGWFSAIESKEVVDFALLQKISEQLRTDIIAIQLSEITGCCGYSYCENGKIIDSYFSEEDEDPLGTLLEYLKSHSISHSILMFREVVNLRSQGWSIVSAKTA